MSKRILKFTLTVIALLSSVAASADDFTVGDLKFTVLDGTANVKVEAASKSISGAVVIPSTVTNPTTNTSYNVTEIPDQGFHSCNMTSIVVPNSVTTLGRAAFANSTNLTDVTIGSGVTALTSDGSLTYGGTFEMCTHLKKVTFAEGNQLTTVESWAFHRCYALEEIVFPSTVTQFGHRVFVDDSSLKRIVLPVSAVPTISTPSSVSNSPNPFDGFSGSSDFRIEVPAAVLPSFLAADIWKDKKYAMQLTSTNVAYLDLKSAFGTMSTNDLNIGHLYCRYRNEYAYWYLINSQEQNVSFVLQACSYTDYNHNDLTLSIISLADDGTETEYETQQFHLFNKNKNEEQFLQYKVDLQNVLPAGRYKVKLTAGNDRIQFKNLYLGSPGKFYCAEYEVKPFGAGDLTPNKLTPNTQWYFTTPTNIELAANPTDTWSTFANWTDEEGNVLSTNATSTFNVNGHKKYVANFTVDAQSIPTNSFNTQQVALYTTSDASKTIGWYTAGSHPLYADIHEGDIATYYVSSTKPALYNMKFKTSNKNDESANYTIEVADKDNNVVFTSATTTIAKTSDWYGDDMTEQTVPITVPLLPNETYTVSIKFGSANHSTAEICNYCDVNFDLVAVVADRVALDKSAETVKVGATTTLVATATASTNDAVTEGYDGVVWSSSNASVATVADGVVTAISAGEAVITATGAQIPSAKASCTITVPVPVASIAAPEAAEVYTGEKVTVTATANPTDAADKTLAWTSSDETIATVDQTGKISGVKAGEATITITAVDRNVVTKTIAVTVKQKVTAITLNKASETIHKGETLQLTATYAPADATLQEVTWTSSDEAIATVTETGLVKALAGGTATITATAKDGKGATATCTVTVEVPVESVSLNQTSANVYKNQNVQLTATVLPEDATNKNVSWTSSNTAIATVADGLVHAVAEGDAVITVASVYNPSLTATFAIHVMPGATAYGEGLNQLRFQEDVNDPNNDEANFIAWNNTTDKQWVANSIVLTDANNFTCPYSVAATSLTYRRTFKNDSWQPLYVPFNMAYSEWSEIADVAKISGVHEYDDGTTLIEFRTVKSGEILPNVPYIIRAKSVSNDPQEFVCTNKTLSASPTTAGSVWCASTERRYTLTGTYTTTTGLEGTLGMSGGSFYTITNAETVLKAMRFYLTVANENHGYGSNTSPTNAPSRVHIMVDGEATGITILGKEINNTAPAYNLQGVRVNDNYKGIVIQNGRKVLKK